MKLTSNETAWMVMAVTLIYSTLQAWIIIKIQTAKDIEKAKQDIKNSVVRFFIRASNLFAVVMLLMQLTSSAPIARSDVFIIFLSFIILFSSLLIRLVQAFADSFTKQIDISTKQINHSTEQIDRLTKLINSLKH